MPYSKFVNGNNGFCPQCKTAPVVRKKNRGTMPSCQPCRDEKRQGRNKRQSTARVNGTRLGKYDALGRRYERKKKNYTCGYCGDPIDPLVNIKGLHTPVCEKEECRKRHKEVIVANRVETKIKERIDKPAYNRNRVRLRLKRIGLPLEWYDAEATRGCGICGAKKPGKKGWSIDHSHDCCPIKKMCSKCIRGLLCTNCNMALGLLKDSPTILRAAIRWLEKKPVKLF